MHDDNACFRVVDTLKDLESNPEAASQPKYIVCCVTDCTPISADENETFGFGLSLRKTKQKERPDFRTPAEFVCSKAFKDFEVRSTKNHRLTFFMPLWLSEKHWEGAKNAGFFQNCRDMWFAKDSPFKKEKIQPSDPVIAVRILCRILTNMVADEIRGGIELHRENDETGRLLTRTSSCPLPSSDDVPSFASDQASASEPTDFVMSDDAGIELGRPLSSIKGNTSDCFISGFFSILRLLKVLAVEYPDIADYADCTWATFVETPFSRKSCPNVGDLLVLLLVTRDRNWDFGKTAFLQEFHIRNVKWCVLAIYACVASSYQ